MIRIIFFLICMVSAPWPLQAGESDGGDRKFMSLLDSVKDPFDNGLPKPVIIVEKPKVVQAVAAPVRPIIIKRVKITSMPKVRNLVFPVLKLDGVVVGEDVHEAIINGQVVSLHGVIRGARLEAVTKEGVEMSFEGKKLFFKVD